MEKYKATNKNKSTGNGTSVSNNKSSSGGADNVESKKASFNNSPSNGANGNVEEEQPKSQDEIDTENNANNIRNAAKVAKATKNPYAMAAGYAVEGLDKMTGGKSTEFLGKTMTQANKMAPGGRQVQDMSNNLNESGASDKIGQAADMKSSASGKGDAASKASKASSAKKASSSSSNKNSTTSSSTSSSSSSFMSDNIMGSSPSGKMKLYVLIGAIGLFSIMFLITVIAGDTDSTNLAATNHTVISESSVGSQPCSSDEIEGMTTYVGNNRLSNIESFNVKYISNTNGGYDNFKNNVFPELETKLSSMDGGAIIFSFDIYDLAYFDSYVLDYKDLVNRFPNVNIYVLSFAPVNNNSYNISNDDLVQYNSKILQNFNDMYIDVYSHMLSGYNTIDGIVYDADSSKKMHDYILKSVSSSEKIMCSGGSIETISDAQLYGGGSPVLTNGENVLHKVTQEDLDKWNSNIITDVNNAGIGNGLAPAIAAYDLVQGAMINNFVIPYFWGGGREIVTGIDPSWGEMKSILLDGNSYQPLGSIHQNGLDELGLINWAIKNGGCSNFTFKDKSELIALGEKIDVFDSVPGDILIANNVTGIILRNDTSKLIIAHAKRKYGVIFGKYGLSQFKSANVIKMSNYYKNNCK